ncbi:hypothetical protein Pyn_09312 [Prunus yedoensis var. nudiflora]|uniref:Uncharacterized protein n=1 Tax=Prunus yedoensis var. nudiflora TaxID=2094558 RepID=A0A314YEH7_PRUYE|nr:hypothetical protein Pyn_09312 [Prunus yedoensis var. nudiflora]
MITLSTPSGKAKLLPWQGFSSPTQPLSLSLHQPRPHVLYHGKAAHIAGDSIFRQASQRPNGGDTCRSHHEPVRVRIRYATLSDRCHCLHLHENRRYARRRLS